MTLVLEQAGTLPVLVPARWRTAWPDLVAAFSTRQGGCSQGPYATLNLGLSTGDERPRVVANRRALFEALGLAPGTVAGATQVHGAGVRAAPALSPQPSWPEAGVVALGQGDVLVAEHPGTFLFATFADCVPVLLVDPRRRAAALAHAGWRGTVAGAAAAAVRALRAGGSRPADLHALIGPAIGPCCYEVGPEVAAAVRAALPEPEGLLRPGREGRSRLDLPEANRRQLLAEGLDPWRVVAAGLCTACRRDLLYSHRAEGGRTGRFAAVLGWRRDAA